MICQCNYFIYSVRILCNVFYENMHMYVQYWHGEL